MSKIKILIILIMLVFSMYFILYYMEFLKFLIISEFFMTFFFFIFMMKSNFNLNLFSIILISMMIIESTLGIFLILENLNMKKIFFFNNLLMF